MSGDGQGRQAHALPSRAVQDALAGAISGAVARVVIGPLDVLKVRFQVQLEPIRKATSAGQPLSKYTGITQALRLIVKEEGIQGLWRGTVPGILLTVPYTGVQFVTLQQCKQWAHRRGLTSQKWKRATSFFSGAAAGAAATLASYPFDLLRTTLAAQGEPKVYNGLPDAVRGIIRQRGFKGLYSGLGVTLLEIVPYAALQFGFYDLFTSAYAAYWKKLQPKGPSKLQDVPEASFARFMCGLLAGTLAKLATHPLDVAKKRFQVAGLQRSMAYGQRIPATLVSSLPACLAQIYRTEGIQGLYKGATLSIAKAAPASAITLTVYEFVAAQLLALAVIKKNSGEKVGELSQVYRVWHKGMIK